jgi:hypothetical protein
VSGAVRIWDLATGQRLGFLDLKTHITAMQARQHFMSIFQGCMRTFES